MKHGQNREGGGKAAVKKGKLHYQFHDPNPTAATADYLLKIFETVHAATVERALCEAARKPIKKDPLQNPCEKYPAL